MSVAELKKMLAEAPDDMKVMVMVEDHLKPDMFAFAEACTCETGITELANEEGDDLKVFLVMPHGAGVAEDDIDNGQETIPELN